MDGYDLVLVARDVERLERLAAELHDEAGANVEVLVADLALAADREKVCDRLAAGVRVLVNNAGFGTSGNFRDLDPKRLSQEIALNVDALTRISHAALKAMVPRGRGYLLNTSSVASFQSAPRLAVYAATKAYVTSLTESLHEEVRGSGVHVTALCPGLTRTEFQSVSNTEEYATQYPGFVWTTAEEVAAAGLRDVAAGKCLSVPGMIYKGLVGVTGVTPRGLARRISGLVLRK